MYDEQFEMFDDETESGLNVEVSKFSDAVIWGTDWTTETIARQLEKGNIDLNPNFQRRDAWNDAEKSRLIESLMLGIPVPPIILAENKNKKNSYIVIDGKQRLLSICRFFLGRKKQDISDDEFEELKLSKLEVLKSLNGQTYSDLCENDNYFLRNLENQTLRTIVIKNWPGEDFLYTVFLRLNTGSKKLSPQELRQALKPGDFLSYLDDATARSKTIMKMMNNTKPDSRMRDIELALRYFAFKIEMEKYTGNLKEFLDYTCEDLNEKWSEESESLKSMFAQLEESINFSYEIFGEKPFSRYTDGKSNRKFNRPIFEILSYYLSVPEIRNILQEKKGEFKEKFIELNNDQDFISSVNDTTKEIRKVVIRHNKIFEIIFELGQGSAIKVNNLVMNGSRIMIDERVI